MIIRAITIFAVLLFAQGCSVFGKKPPEPVAIDYELTSLGLPTACVSGEEKCRDLPEETQREIIIALVSRYGVGVKEVK